MLALRSLARVALLLSLLSGFATASESGARFDLVTADDADQLQRRLARLGSRGYRLVAAGLGAALDGRPRLAALLERGGAAAIDYAVVSGDGNPRDGETGARIEELAAAGYRLHPQGVLLQPLGDHWLPESAYADRMTLILERSPESPARSYEFVTFGDEQRYYENLEEKRRDGFEIVGMWNTGRLLQLVMERPPAGSATSDEAIESRHRLLFTATRTALKSDLKRAARGGWRVVAADDASVTGPPLLLIASGAEPSGLRYGFVDKLPKKLRKDKLEQVLNKRARHGWRVVSDGATEDFLALQRSSEEIAPVTYKVISSRRAPGLPAALERAVDEGFRFVAMFVEPDETSVLVERAEPLPND